MFKRFIAGFIGSLVLSIVILEDLMMFSANYPTSASASLGRSESKFGALNFSFDWANK
jgi:hypothetical protein